VAGLVRMRRPGLAGTGAPRRGRRDPFQPNGRAAFLRTTAHVGIAVHTGITGPRRLAWR